MRRHFLLGEWGRKVGSHFCYLGVVALGGVIRRCATASIPVNLYRRGSEMAVMVGIPVNHVACTLIYV